MLSFFKFYILGTIQANYIHYKMINIFLCCNGRPLAPCSLDLDLDTALVSFELMAAYTS